MENAREVVVIGGGIAGLTCAWKLLERGAGRLRVTVGTREENDAFLEALADAALGTTA